MDGLVWDGMVGWRYTKLVVVLYLRKGKIGYYQKNDATKIYTVEDE
jgi:hypothetical protein